MTVQDLHSKTHSILSKHGVTKAAVFGSHARGTQKKSSDIDILIELGKPMSLLDFSGLKISLEDSLAKKVDLVQYKNLKPSLKPYILKDEQVFYKV